MKNIIGYLSNGKGLPDYFKDEYVLEMLGLHDSYKSIDYIYGRCKESGLFDEEQMTQIKNLFDAVRQKYKEYGALEIMLHKAFRRNTLDENVPIFTDEDREYLAAYLEKNKKILQNEILNSK